MNASESTLSNLARRNRFFVGYSTEDIAEDPFYRLIRVFQRRVNNLLWCCIPRTEELFATPSIWLANERSDWDQPGGLDWNRLKGKPWDYSQPPGHAKTTENQAGITTDDKRNTITNPITHLNHCLWTRRAPTTAV
jgi:hypothetical protein